MDRPKLRSWHPTSAALRTAGPMRDRRAPRGGARNDHADLLAEYEEERREGPEERRERDRNPDWRDRPLFGRPDLTEGDAAAERCPECEASPGQPCIGPEGHVARAHTGRVERAEARPAGLHPVLCMDCADTVRWSEVSGSTGICTPCTEKRYGPL